METDVFISYRRKDSEFVAQLHQELTDRSISAWFDKADIQVSDHWRTSIAEGIRNCKVFVLVLSPDAVISPNIRKEVDLAEKHRKTIVPLLWKETDIPPAFEYSLAGIQWIDFKETVSAENFDQLANVIQRLIGGTSMAEATKDTQITTPSPFPDGKGTEAKPAAATPASKPSGGRKGGGLQLGGGKRTGGGLQLGGKKVAVNPVALGGRVIANVITTSDLDIDTQDVVNLEINWLFRAIDHVFKLNRQEITLTEPVARAIPETALYLEDANNTLRSGLDYARTIEANMMNHLKIIKQNLDNLDTLLDREAFGGEEAKRNINLQNQIKESRLSVIEAMKVLAQTIGNDDAYGITVTAPRQLADLLA